MNWSKNKGNGEVGSCQLLYEGLPGHDAPKSRPVWSRRNPSRLPCNGLGHLSETPEKATLILRKHPEKRVLRR